MNLGNKIKSRAIYQSTSSLTLPKAMLMIPDGNGRWAKKLGLPISEGHKQGGNTMAVILEHFLKIGIDVLGIWGFSEDNWKRPKEEIDKIMEVISSITEQNLDSLLKNNIKFLCLGQMERIEKEYPKTYKSIKDAIDKTEGNKAKTLVLFLDYGERYQLEEFAKAREKDQKSSTYELLSKINGNIPMFDMVLRTSGEQRLSGFGPLASLAEFISVDKNLPELSDMDILDALKEFSGRQRRFGGR